MQHTIETTAHEVTIAVQFELMTRGLLAQRFRRHTRFQEAYQACLRQGLIHEDGTGKRGDPCFVKPGPAPIKEQVTILPVLPERKFMPIILAITDDTILDFLVKLTKCPAEWNLKVGEEINKALEAYTPDRPY